MRPIRQGASEERAENPRALSVQRGLAPGR
jgi:hypothetical protein